MALLLQVYSCIHLTMREVYRRKRGRPRNAAATRKAILASARRAFVRAGYEGAGVREIASGAGVTAMLVNRYFGSKERLFAEVVAETMADPVILTPRVLGSQDRSAAIAEALVELTRTGARPLDGFLILHRSGSSARAAAIGRAQIERHHQRTLASALRGPRAPERAAVALSLVAGFQMMRQMIRLSALTAAPPQRLERLLAPLFRSLVEGDEWSR
jgi:AcrR family transcriptional regulator